MKKTFRFFTKTVYGLCLLVIAFFAMNGLYFGYNGNDDLAMGFLVPVILLLALLPICSIEE